MTKTWQAVHQFVLSIVAAAAFVLAVIGLPFAILVAVLFSQRYFSSTRPGVLGLEDVIRALIGLAWKWGLATAALALLGLIIAQRV
jgi:hypothetical protein